ncbi:hypothetical protein [Streptomyces sp. CFMR 7]|uniref:hypothetical protein n=1 Tax=Streptomyces sp. CFMR 7 TaxID=1649184 RepID=UPI0021B68B29|nr:hypothetical protein [Streptomyces sp. CFMR 7]
MIPTWLASFETVGNEALSHNTRPPPTGWKWLKELLGHAHIGVNAHVRLRLQRQTIDALGNALGLRDDEPGEPPSAAVVR